MFEFRFQISSGAFQMFLSWWNLLINPCLFESGKQNFDEEDWGRWAFKPYDSENWSSSCVQGAIQVKPGLLTISICYFTYLTSKPTGPWHNWYYYVPQVGSFKWIICDSVAYGVVYCYVEISTWTLTAYFKVMPCPVVILVIYMHGYVFGKHPRHDPKMPLGRGLLGPELARCSMEASFSSHA